LIEGFSEKFEVKTKLLDSSFQVHLRDVSTSGSGTLPLYISLNIPSDKSEYKIECFEIKKGSGNEEELSKLYGVKVEGPWNLEILKKDLYKMIKREFKTFRPRYYPF